MSFVTDPEFLPEVEADLAALQSRWPAAVSVRCRRYSHFCWIPSRFAGAFPHVSRDALRTLTTFCQLFVGAILVQDKLLDGCCPPAEVGLASMRVMAMQAEATHVLHTLFPSSSPFWERYFSYLSDHARAFAEEDAYRRGGRPLALYTQPVAMTAAADKIGLTRIALAALATLEGSDAMLEPVFAAVAGTGEAMAMYDDLIDWREDLRNGQPSLLLHLALHELPHPLTDAEYAALTPGVARAIYYGGHADHVLSLALAALDRADALEALVPDLLWYEHTRAVRKIYTDTREALRLEVGESLKRARGASRRRRPASAAQHDLVRAWRPRLVG